MVIEQEQLIRVVLHVSRPRLFVTLTTEALGSLVICHQPVKAPSHLHVTDRDDKWDSQREITDTRGEMESAAGFCSWPWESGALRLKRTHNTGATGEHTTQEPLENTQHRSHWRTQHPHQTDRRWGGEGNVSGQANTQTHDKGRNRTRTQPKQKDNKRHKHVCTMLCVMYLVCYEPCIFRAPVQITCGSQCSYVSPQSCKPWPATH